ncbi:MAG: formate dehydrogenase subunit gamma [Alphaproteobacteria bacterium]
MKLRILALLAALLMGAAAPAMAQTAPRAPSMAEEMEVQALLRGGSIQGRISIPDEKLATLIQPEGREWREFHNITLAWVGGIAVLGMVALLVVFRLKKGRIPIESGPAGRTILRFNTLERANHWMVASTFIILGLSGLNLTFGRHILLPIVGPEAFTAISQWGKYAHNFLAFPFTLGIVIMLLIWVKDNIPNARDIAWFKAGGGLIGNKHPEAGRFNGGQKMVFWVTVLGGAVVAVSGYLLIFPFFFTDVAGMQLSHVIHGLLSVLMVAALLAHIYIGSVGMEGAFDAMGTGQVDLNWAKQHHPLWVQEEMAKGRAAEAPPGAEPSGAD